MRTAAPRPARGTRAGRTARLTRARAIVTAAVLAAVLAVCSGCRAHATSPTTSTAASAASAFFAHYVESDGRVVRTDQGGDTVSEGQAYAMLLAVDTGDRATFDLTWAWTKAHLQRPDALLAYHWANGAVVDSNPAPDADLDTAVALFRGAAAFDEPDLRVAAKAIAHAVLTYESVTASPGTLVTAGTWAVANPAVLNPSYLVSGTATYLAEQTGDPAWQAVATATAALDRQLALDSTLPPDWASLPAGRAASAVTAHGTPDGSTGPQYGMEAPRLIIRLAASCSPTDRALAAAYATRVGTPGRAGEQTLDGTALVEWRSPLTDLAVYAARSAAGDSSGAAAALASARTLAKNYPTYYGTAWLALAPSLLSNTAKDC